MIVEVNRYQSKENSDLGFFIETMNGKTTLWKDEFEGGDANEMDWMYVDEFEDQDAAINYIVKNYGEIFEKEFWELKKK